MKDYVILLEGYQGLEGQVTETQEKALMEALASEDRVISFEDADGLSYVDKRRIQAIWLNPVKEKRTIGF